ncbi:hypothetical protein JCM11641_004784 [Rhodosporidiobolus odoratus]
MHRKARKRVPYTLGVSVPGVLFQPAKPSSTLCGFRCYQSSTKTTDLAFSVVHARHAACNPLPPLSSQRTLPVADNPFSERVNATTAKSREARRRPYYAQLYVVKEDGEPALRQWALSCLIEDRIEALPSYQQCLGQLKDAVKDKSF